MQIYRAQYGDAMLVSPRGTPTWQPEINKNIWNSLLLWERLLFPHELTYIHINTSPNTWTVQTAKNHKKRPFFRQESFVMMPSWCHVQRKSRKFKMHYFKHKERNWAGNLWKDIFWVVPSPDDDKNLADLASFDFRVLWRHMQTSNICTSSQENCKFPKISLSLHFTETLKLVSAGNIIIVIIEMKQAFLL